VRQDAGSNQVINPFLEATMEKLSARWERLIRSSSILRFVDINLRGIGQVMFQNNPLSGALFLAAVGWG
jgi:urea transporter